LNYKLDPRWTKSRRYTRACFVRMHYRNIAIVIAVFPPTHFIANEKLLLSEIIRLIRKVSSDFSIEIKDEKSEETFQSTRNTFERICSGISSRSILSNKQRYRRGDPYLRATTWEGTARLREAGERRKAGMGLETEGNTTSRWTLR